MSSARITIPKKKIAQLCQRYHVTKLSLFGSVLREDFHSQSDVDVLVEFEKGHTPGLAFFSLQDELSEIFGRKVDLNTAGFLSPHFRAEALAAAEIEYVAP